MDRSKNVSVISDFLMRILMYTVSFDKKALNITIRNLYPDLELTSPVYFSNGTTCHISPNQQADPANTVEASFGIDPKQYYFKGALLYKLQKKHTTRTDNRSSSSTASIKDTATNIHLLVVWSVDNNHYNRHVCLIECADDFIWDEDKLWALYRVYDDEQFCELCESNMITWLIHDNTVMKTRFDMTYESNYKLDIVISGGNGKYNMKRPMKIDTKRLVLPL
jgi:hypothetical protein